MKKNSFFLKLRIRNLIFVGPVLLLFAGHLNVKAEAGEVSTRKPSGEAFPSNKEPLPPDSSAAPSAVDSPGEETHIGIWAEVAKIISTQQRKLVSDEEYRQTGYHTLSRDQLEIDVMLRWDEASRPAECLNAVIEEIITDTGENLLEEKKMQSPFSGQQIGPSRKGAIASATVSLPSPEATSIRYMKGYVPIVSKVVNKVVLIQDPASKVGRGKLEDDTLKLFGVYLKNVNGPLLNLVIEGDVLESIRLLNADGDPIMLKSGTYGMENHSYIFSEDIGAGDCIELTFRLSGENAKVPFEAREILLP